MTDLDWRKLCAKIFDRKCILMIGPDFQIEVQDGGEKKETTFNELLKDKLAESILSYSRLPANYRNDLPKKDFCELARDFIVFSGELNFEARGNLEITLSDYLEDCSATLESKSFERLSALPFNFIIDTNFGNLFYNILSKAKKPKRGFYNFKGDQVTLSNISSENQPFVYNLYGSIKQPNSLALTDYDLIQLLSNIIGKTPALPADIRAQLANEETSILFLGFGMLAKNWYFRILLHALTTGNKKTMSYALEYLSNINYDEDPTVLFFKDELKVCLYHLDHTQFIETLVTKYTAFAARQQRDSPGETTSPKASDSDVKVFVSYKREDKEKVSAIVQRLEANNIKVLWDQSTDFTGNWAQKIESLINDSQAFILLQSNNLKNSQVNYVNVEIRLAENRSMYFPKQDSYLYPSYIDSPESRITDADFRFIRDINNYDLSDPSKVDSIATKIIRNLVRNKNLTVV